MGVKHEMKEDFDNMAKQKEIIPDKELATEINRILYLNSGNAKRLQYFIFHYSGNVYGNYNDLLFAKDIRK